MLRSVSLVGVLLMGLFIGLGCDRDSNRKSEITVRNDILDREYNVVVVDRVMSHSGLSGKSYTLRPQEEQEIQGRGITGLRFSRKYKDFTRVYEVTCPDDPSKRIVLKLIDVHLNKLPAGCELTKASRSH